MIEIAFDGTTAGSLKSARAYDKDGKMKDSVILWFDWMLNVGTLQDGIESQYRRELPMKLYMQGYHGDDEEENLSEYGDASLKNWKALKALLNKGELVRIWYGQSPHSICGFYHLCALLRNYENDVYVMKTPDVVKGGNRTK